MLKDSIEEDEEINILGCGDEDVNILSYNSGSDSEAE